VTDRVLVAGIGNIFFADDGFGVEVAHRLLGTDLPPGVRVVDYGIRGMHLAYDMLDGYHTVILVDAVGRGDPPGTVTVLDLTDAGGTPGNAGGTAGKKQLDPHGMTPDAVLDLVATLGGTAGRVLLVGCEPESTEERIGLGPAVSDAVGAGTRAVLDLARAALALT
jgi:hydrogenase maturation protease